MAITRSHTTPACHSEATYSDCGTYRYRLTRTWDPAGKRLAFVMLNPSTASEKANDATIARCEKRSRLMGYGTLDVVNLFAYRATAPTDLCAAEAPIGPDNDLTLRRAAAEADLILAAWGVHGTHRGRDAEVTDLLIASGRPVHTLGLTRHGLPRHPLYVSYAQKTGPWRTTRR